MDARSTESKACRGKTMAVPQHNPERRVQPLDSLPTPAFDLVDFDAYERPAVFANWPMPPASAVPMPAITAPTWCSTNGASMLSRRNA